MTEPLDCRDPSPAFPSTVLLAGLGPFGRALAKSIRHHHPACRIIGMDVDAAVATRALLDGQVDALETSLEGVPSGVDAVVLAVPHAAIPSILGGLAGRIPSDVFVTDTLYLNGPVLSLAARAGLERQWISASPAVVLPAESLPAGSLSADLPGGTQSASLRGEASDVLAGAEVRLSASVDADAALCARAEAFWKGLGGDAFWMDAVAQDQLAAWSIALPQLVGNALAGALHAAGIPRSALPAQFQGMVVPAELPASRWVSLLDAAAPATGTGLTSVSRALQVVADLLARRHVERIGEFMDRTRGWAEGTPQAPEPRQEQG
jgi:prephenate dehydrogenase